MRLLIASFLCLVLLLFSTVASAKIVFDSTRNQDYELYVMDDDGTNIVQLTHTERPIRVRVMCPQKKRDTCRPEINAMNALMMAFSGG